MSTSSLPSSTFSGSKLSNGNFGILKTNTNGAMSSDEENAEFKSKLHSTLSCSDGESCESDANENNSRESDTEMRLMIEALEKKKDEKYYNKSFSQNKLREIERNNTLLMNKILSNNVRKNQYPAVNVPQIKMTSNTINKKKKQLEIDRNNLVSTDE